MKSLCEENTMRKEKQKDQAVKMLEKFVKDISREEVPEYIREAIEEMQQEAFMEGYQYAIAILKEAMGKNEW